MKKLNFWLLASLFMGSLAFTACSSSDGDGGGGDDPTPPAPAPVQPVNPSDMTMAKLSGFVYRGSGTSPFSGVKVTSGTATTTTNESGAFTLSQVNIKNGRAVVKFEYDNYIDVVRSAVYKEGDQWEVHMKSANTESFPADQAKTIQPSYSETNMKVVIPANELVAKNAAGNEVPISGYVKAESTYLNPNDPDFESQMPGGDLVGIGNPEATGEEQLVSYGMVSVSMTDQAGNSVNLKSKEAGGNGAEITFPAPEGLEAHEKIPLWYFDEEAGVWKYEGMAKKQDDGTYKGTVYHFSWHNLDYPEKRATLNINVKDDSGTPVAFQRVVYGQSSASTDKDGNISVFVPTNTAFKVYVKSSDYANYTPEVVQDVAKITQAGSVHQVNLVLPKLAHISGAITNNGAGVQASVNVSYGGGETKSVMSAVDGKYYLKLPANYVGSATLNIMAADGTVYHKNIVLTGGDITENFEINPPAVLSGSFTFTSSDGGTVITQTVYDVPAYEYGGIVILGNDMANINYGSSGDAVSFSKSASAAGFDWYRYKDGTSESISSRGESGFALDFAAEGTKANVTMNGPGSYVKDYGSGVNGTITGSFPYSILANFNTPATLESWVPTVAGATPKYSYSFANSPKLGNGWIYFYNNGETLDQFMTLVNAAKAYFGEPYDYMDDQDDPDDWMKYYIFVKGNQGVQLSYRKDPYQGWEPDIHSILSGGHHGSEVAIAIRAFSNITIPYDAVFSGHYK